MICGPSRSTTVTSKLHTATFPAASVPRQLTLLVPSGKTLPEGGLHSTVAAGQLSAIVTLYATAASHAPNRVLATRFVGHDNTGNSRSATLTVKEQLAWLPTPSVAMQFTVVVPFGNLVPEAGLHVTVTELQSSLAATAKPTMREHCPGSVFV